MPDEESPTSSQETAQETSTSGFHISLIGGHNIWEWVFLAVATWNVALHLASSGVALAQCQLFHSLLNPEFSTELIVIMASIIALGFAIYGIHEEHQHDIYLHIIFISIADFFSYLAAGKDCHSCFKIICFFVATAMTLINCAMAYKATTASDWTEFRIIGASESLAALYKRQCLFLSVLKFDTLFVVLCAIYSFPITLEFPNIRNLYLLLSLIIMYSLMSWGCGKITVSKEDKYLAAGFVVLCITYPCLVTYQIYMSKLHRNAFPNQLFYFSAQYTGVIIVGCKLLLTGLMVLTCKTFGYGLNTRSVDILKKWLDHSVNRKAPSEKHMWIKFLRECLHLKCSAKAKEREFTYQDIYRF